MIQKKHKINPTKYFFSPKIFLIAMLFYLALVAIPVVFTLGASFFHLSSLHHIISLQQNTFLLLGQSALMAFLIALLSTFFGTLLGFLLYQTKVPFQNFFKIALLIPLFISPYILAVAWKDFFFFFFNNTHSISSYLGVILVLSSIFTPLSMLIIGSALSHIHQKIVESALMITAFPKVFFRLILPLIKPALLSSFVLIFIFSISEFSVPAFFGVKVFTTEIFTQFAAFYNHSLAITQSVLLILISMTLLLAERKHIANAPFFSLGEKGSSTQLYHFKNLKWVSFLFISIWFFITVILPFTFLILQSFKNGFAPFIQAFELLKPSFSPSIMLAFISALIIVFIGFSAAYISEIQKKNHFQWALLLLFAFPSTILGISLIKFYNRPLLDFIYSGYAILVIAYVGKFSFIAAKLIANALKQIPPSLDEAAQIQGISFFKRLQSIFIPLLMPTLFISFIISFILSLGELGTSIMIYPPGTEIMPIKVFTIMANAPQSLTSSMTLIQLSLTLLLISSFYFIGKPFTKNHFRK